MKAILLAAGLGTRLKPLTDTIPKCLVPVRERPLLDIWLANLTAAGFGPFLINTHYLSETVTRFIAESPFRDTVTVVHEAELLGTGGTLLFNRGFFGREDVFVAHADNLCVCDFNAFRVAHESRPAGTAMTMMTFRTDSPRSCGIVELDARGVVVGFHEKVPNPPGNLANGAVYILSAEVVDFMASLAKRFIDLSTEVVPSFVGRIHTWHNGGVHRDIGTMASWQAAQRDRI